MARQTAKTTVANMWTFLPQARLFSLAAAHTSKRRQQAQSLWKPSGTMGRAMARQAAASATCSTCRPIKRTRTFLPRLIQTIGLAVAFQTSRLTPTPVPAIASALTARTWSSRGGAHPGWGLIALLNQKHGTPVGFINPVLYSHAATVFKDITVGNNGAYPANSGWDACTGLGSANGTALAHALTGSIPAASA